MEPVLFLYKSEVNHVAIMRLKVASNISKDSRQCAPYWDIDLNMQGRLLRVRWANLASRATRQRILARVTLSKILDGQSVCVILNKNMPPAKEVKAQSSDLGGSFCVLAS